MKILLNRYASEMKMLKQRIYDLEHKPDNVLNGKLGWNGLFSLESNNNESPLNVSRNSIIKIGEEISGVGQLYLKTSRNSRHNS